MFVFNHLIKYIKFNNKINHIYNGYYILIIIGEIFLLYIKNGKPWFQLSMDYSHSNMNIQIAIKYRSKLSLETKNIFDTHYRHFFKAIDAILKKYFDPFEHGYLDRFSIEITHVGQSYIIAAYTGDMYEDEEFLRLNKFQTRGLLNHI